MVLYGWDRFRLDVGVDRAHEVYSWAGADRFEDRDLNDLIPGLASSGAFASLLHMMFGGDVAEFLYRGKQTLDRRRLLAYSFRVPVPNSHYFLRGASGTRKAVAYREPYSWTRKQATWRGLTSRSTILRPRRTFASSTLRWTTAGRQSAPPTSCFRKPRGRHS